MTKSTIILRSQEIGTHNYSIISFAKVTLTIHNKIISQENSMQHMQKENNSGNGNFSVETNFIPEKNPINS